MTKKERSTMMLNKDVYKEIRILAIRKGMYVSDVMEEAMKEKLERESKVNKK